MPYQSDAERKQGNRERMHSEERSEEEEKNSSSISLNDEERKEIQQYHELQQSLKNLKQQVGAGANRATGPKILSSKNQQN